MISAINGNNPSFTCSIPTKVFIDGLETFDEKLIKSSCRQLSTILAGPCKNKHQYSIIERFAEFVPDYNLNKGITGYANTTEKAKPSDYIRCVINKKNTYLLTGIHANYLQNYGRNIGYERAVCKERGAKTSFDLMAAKQNYKYRVNSLINNTKIRLREIINKTQLGKPLTLNINMKSNGKYGLTTFKINLENIKFSAS